MEIYIPDSVSIIDDGAFDNCISLKKIHLSNILAGISPYTFFNCVNLMHIDIPDSVTTIGDYAFGNTILSYVNTNSIENWCGYSFYSSNSNPIYTSHKLYLNGELITDLVIPESVTVVNAAAFGFLQLYKLLCCKRGRQYVP